MNLNKLTITIFVLLCSLYEIQAQFSISGKVTNAITKANLEGANISIEKNKGATTNANGEFIIENLSSGTYNLTVSFVGFNNYYQNITLEKSLFLDIQLSPGENITDEIVITATRNETLLKNIPGRVNVITPKQLQSIPKQSIDDVFNYLPGINVNRPFGIFSSKATITMRGLSGKEQARVLVLVDGIPVNKTDGGTVNWNRINSDNVEKIEIAKGPTSSLYGGNAMGGVINIITQKPVNPFSGKISLSYGTYNTLTEKLYLAGRPKDSKFSWSINSLARKSDGYITQAKIDQTKYTTKSNVKEIIAGTKLTYDISSKSFVSATFNYYNDLHGTGEKVYQENGNYTGQETFQSTISYKTVYKDIFINTSVFYQRENYTKVNDYLSDNRYNYYDVLSKRSDAGIFIHATKSISFNKFITGLEVKQGSVDASDVYYTSTDKVNNAGIMDFGAAFINDEISLNNEKLIINAGIRFDYARFHDGEFTIENPSYALSYLTIYQVPEMKTTSWTALSPKLSAQYKFSENFRLYYSYSKGFRPSILDDMCRSGKISGGFKIANPNLKPEYLDNFEIGTDFSPNKSLQFELSAFNSIGKNFMYYISTGDSVEMPTGTVPVMVRDNISKVNIIGLEFKLIYTFSKNFITGINYTFSHSQIKDYKINNPLVDADLTDKYLTDVPDHLISGSINWNNSFINIGIFGRYIGEMWINDKNGFDNKYLLSYKYPSYLIVDLKFSKVLFQKCELSSEIQNIFDKKYYDSKAAICPGRLISFELTYKF